MRYDFAEMLYMHSIIRVEAHTRNYIIGVIISSVHAMYTDNHVRLFIYM